MRRLYRKARCHLFATFLLRFARGPARARLFPPFKWQQSGRGMSMTKSTLFAAELAAQIVLAGVAMLLAA
jgi:hypothetical protein